MNWDEAEHDAIREAIRLAGVANDTGALPPLGSLTEGRAAAGEPLAPRQGSPRTASRTLAMLVLAVAVPVFFVSIGYVARGMIDGPGRVGSPVPSLPAVVPDLAPSSSADAGATKAPTPTVSPRPTFPGTFSPAPTPAPTERPATTVRIHIVKSGETLTRIAARYGTTVKAIVDANGIANASLIITGQKLVIPVP